MTHSSVHRVDNRYEIRIGGAVAGFTEYADRGDQRVFYHTEIDRALRGQGLSSVLIEQALTDTRRAGKRIVGTCPAVSAYLQKHDAFADITDPTTPDILTWLNQVLA